MKKRYLVEVSEDSKIMFGKPCIAGTRLPVELLQNGLTKFKHRYPETVKIKGSTVWWSNSIKELKV